MPEYTWPDSFANGMRNEREFYPDEQPDKRKGRALAEQLSAWGICMSGGNIPKTFGHTMEMLSQITGAAGPDECSAAAKTYLKGA